MKKAELIDAGHLPEGVGKAGLFERVYRVTVDAPISDEALSTPCRMCVLGEATGIDELCDYCRSAVISSRCVYSPPEIGELQRK